VLQSSSRPNKSLDLLEKIQKIEDIPRFPIIIYNLLIPHIWWISLWELMENHQQKDPKKGDPLKITISAQRPPNPLRNAQPPVILSPLHRCSLGASFSTCSSITLHHLPSGLPGPKKTTRNPFGFSMIFPFKFTGVEWNR